MDCRSEEKRREIVKAYNVKPVAHLQLLSGQKKHSDAGQTIKNDYYIFEAMHKMTGKKEIIQCGMVAARDFLRLLNSEGLPLFNPLCNEEKCTTNEKGETKSKKDTKNIQTVWNPKAKQLYNAIMWVIVIIDAKPNTAIFDLKEKVYRYKDKEPFPKYIRAVNTIIKNSIRDSTLTEKINKLKETNKIKDDVCKFDLLIQSFEHMEDKEGNPIVIEPLF